MCSLSVGLVYGFSGLGLRIFGFRGFSVQGFQGAV